MSNQDRETAIGLELIQLCQTITEDGKVLDEEVVQLKQWLDTNRHVDMSSIPFLCQMVEGILADGVVTDSERTELQRCIERVLPADLRAYAVLVRKEKAAEAKKMLEEARELAKVAKREEKSQKELERIRNTPIARFNVMVAGIAYENRANAVRRLAYENAPVYLARDLANAYSRNAIEIRMQDGSMIGFIPESEAQYLAAFLDDGCRVRANITKMLTKTRTGYPIPVVAGNIYGAESDVDGARLQSQMPPRRNEESSTAGAGCLPGCSSGCALIVCAAVLMTLYLLWGR